MPTLAVTVAGEKTVPLWFESIQDGSMVAIHAPNGERRLTSPELALRCFLAGHRGPSKRRSGASSPRYVVLSFCTPSAPSASSRIPRYVYVDEAPDEDEGDETQTPPSPDLWPAFAGNRFATLVGPPRTVSTGTWTLLSVGDADDTDDGARLQATLRQAGQRLRAGDADRAREIDRRCQMIQEHARDESVKETLDYCHVGQPNSQPPTSHIPGLLTDAPTPPCASSMRFKC